MARYIQQLHSVSASNGSVVEFPNFGVLYGFVQFLHPYRNFIAALGKVRPVGMPPIPFLSLPLTELFTRTRPRAEQSSHIARTCAYALHTSATVDVDIPRRRFWYLERGASEGSIAGALPSLVGTFNLISGQHAVSFGSSPLLFFVAESFSPCLCFSPLVLLLSDLLVFCLAAGGVALRCSRLPTMFLRLCLSILLRWYSEPRMSFRLCCATSTAFPCGRSTCFRVVGTAIPVPIRCCGILSVWWGSPERFTIDRSCVHRPALVRPPEECTIHRRCVYRPLRLLPEKQGYSDCAH
jgi:hypothetical protein